MILGGRRGARRAGAGAPQLGRGERVLARADSLDGPVVGTRDALYLPGGLRRAWHELDGADWDAEAGVLTVREVGTYGEVRPVHRLELGDPRRLLQLVRERVTASIVLTRHVPLEAGAAAGRGVTVIGRRPTTGLREPVWFVEYDAGVDPEDPAVAAVVARALADARDDVGAA